MSPINFSFDVPIIVGLFSAKAHHSGNRGLNPTKNVAVPKITAKELHFGGTMAENAKLLAFIPPEITFALGTLRK